MPISSPSWACQDRKDELTSMDLTKSQSALWVPLLCQTHSGGSGPTWRAARLKEEPFSAWGLGLAKPWAALP